MSSTSHDDLIAYLERTGWRSGEPGAYGSLWARAQAAPVGITHTLDSSSPDWCDTVTRIARALERTPAEVLDDLAMLRHDEIEFAATGVDGGIGLDAGAALFEMARRVVWNTTAAAYNLRPRPSIRGSFSKTTRLVVDQLSFGHTRVGSYAVPVRYPLTRDPMVATDQVEQQFEEARENSEALQRRASRTLMQALSFVSSQIVEPAAAPTTQVLLAGVRAGVTLELVTALRDVLRRGDAFDSVRTSARWATLTREPAVASSIVLETAALDVLEVARQRLADMRPTEQEVISGPLVGVLDIDPEADRQAGVSAVVEIQTMRHGRSSKVRVSTAADQWHQVSGWLHNGEIVIASGTVVSEGGALVLSQPSRLNPIGQVIIPGTG